MFILFFGCWRSNIPFCLAVTTPKHLHLSFGVFNLNDQVLLAAMSKISNGLQGPANSEHTGFFPFASKNFEHMLCKTPIEKLIVTIVGCSSIFLQATSKPLDHLECSGICLLLWIYLVVENDAVWHGIQDYAHAAKDETPNGWFVLVFNSHRAKLLKPFRKEMEEQL